MQEFVEIVISLQTVILCVTIFMIMTIGRIVADRLKLLDKSKLNMFIKWGGTMWLPLWPLIIGIVLVHLPSMPLHPKLAVLHGMPKHMFGAFAGMCSAGLITQVSHLLYKMGVEVKIPGMVNTKKPPSIVPPPPDAPPTGLP